MTPSICSRSQQEATGDAVVSEGLTLVRYFELAGRGRVSIHIERKRKRRTSRGAFAKLTTMAYGRPRITEDPPLRVTLGDREQADLVSRLLAGYRLTLAEDRRALFDRFTVVDMVREHPIVAETPKSASERGARAFVPRGSTAKRWSIRPVSVPRHDSAPPKPEPLRSPPR
jgi:Uncharacterized protein conserved in bacteria (DUF2252)